MPFVCYRCICGLYVFSDLEFLDKIIFIKPGEVFLLLQSNLSKENKDKILYKGKIFFTKLVWRDSRIDFVELKPEDYDVL